MSRDSDSEEEVDGLDFEFATVHSMRLKMFSDTVWAIIATIMIVPIMNSGISKEITVHHGGEMEKTVKGIIPQLVIYFLAFLIVCGTWSCHVWTFQIMKHVTDLSIITNLIVLTAASLLPYFYSLMSRFRNTTSIIIYCMLQIFIGVIQCLQVLHAFSYQEVLKPVIEQKTDLQKKKLKTKIICRLLVTPIFCLIAIFLAFVSTLAALICLGMLLVYPWIQSCIRAVLSRVPVCAELQGRRIYSADVMLTERIAKVRIEGFSDGVFAITSTLLALDITENYVPTVVEVNENYSGDVRKALLSYWGMYVAYLLMFVIVGTLWFTQLTLFKNIIRFSRMMQFINNWCLACVGMIPLAFTFILHFKILASVITGIRFSCVAILLVGVFFNLIYLVAFIFDRCNRPKNEVWLSMRVQYGGADFGLFLFQMIGLPLGSMLVFGLTYLPDKTISIYVNVAIIILYVCILILWRTIANNLFTGDQRTPASREYDEIDGTNRREEPDRPPTDTTDVEN